MLHSAGPQGPHSEGSKEKMMGRFDTKANIDNYGAEVRAILESGLLGDLDSKVTHWTDSLGAKKMIDTLANICTMQRIVVFVVQILT